MPGLLGGDRIGSIFSGDSMSTDMLLPPLPEPWILRGNGLDLFAADQMRDYARSYASALYAELTLLAADVELIAMHGTTPDARATTLQTRNWAESWTTRLDKVTA